jgi:uncharacterized protein (DUF2384 family)
VVACACSGSGVFAQTTEAPALPGMRIEETGTRIPRTDTETALPVQVIDRDENPARQLDDGVRAEGARVRELQRRKTPRRRSAKRAARALRVQTSADLETAIRSCC